MSERPRCIVGVAEAPAIAFQPEGEAGSVVCRVRPLSDVAGLTQMGVRVREIAPGRAGTHLHFHDTEEEWAYVLAGRGRLALGTHSRPVRSGHFAGFPPIAAPHHFVAEGEDPLVILEGGERRRGEDACTYPELGVRSRNGVDEPIDVASLTLEEADPDQLVHREDVPEVVHPHPLRPEAIRNVRSLARIAGLARQAFSWVRLEPGIASTTFHRHDSTDEWVYVLSGELDARIGEEWSRVGGGDFVAHPAGGPAHEMRARTEATYLMGGQSSPDDIVRYPEHGMLLGPDGFRRERSRP